MWSDWHSQLLYKNVGLKEVHIMDYISTKDVAKMLNVSPTTITYYIRTKKLPAIKLGKSYQISKSDLITFLESRKTIKEEK